MKKYVFVDAFGREVSEHDAKDSRGTLRAGYGVRTSMSFMDSARNLTDADTWASSPVGAAAIAREGYIAELNRRPARTAADMFADAQAGEARLAAALPVLDAMTATAAVLAREARAQMIADLNRDRSREAAR